MVADAYDAVRGVDGVDAVDIVLEDHFAADEINAGVAARAGFVASFDGLAEHELDELRRDFLRKAMLAAQDRVVRPLLAAGVRPDELGAARLGDVPALGRPRPARGPGATSWASRRATTIRCSCSADGATVERGDVPVHLRRSRTVRVSIDANGDYCRQLLAQRYDDSTDGTIRPAPESSRRAE